MWSKLCCGQKWLLLLSPVFLLFLTIFAMKITLHLPLPLADIDRRSSRALSSAVEFRSRPGVVEVSPATAYQQPLTQVPHRFSSARRESVAHKPSWEAADNDSIKERRYADLCRNKHKSKGFAPKTKEMLGGIQHPASQHSHLERSKSTAAQIPAPADTPGSDRRVPERHLGRWNYRHTNRNANTQLHERNAGENPAEHHQALGKHRLDRGKSDKVSQEQQAVRMLFKDLEKHHNLSENPSEAKKNPGSLDHTKTLSKVEAAMKTDDSGWCLSLTEQDFPDSDLRRIRISPGHHLLPWFSEDDIHKMVVLAEGEVVSKTKVPAHGQVLQVALDPPAHQQPFMKRDSPHHGPGHTHPETHSECCQQGHCSLIKRTDDWFEVFAFHLDRVLGLNRSLPAVLRTFHSNILPYRYLSGRPRPVVWWDPDIQHLADRDNDQNSVPLSWLQYQKLLEAHYGSEADLKSAPCVGIHHSEWGRLALFDFLLQVNDRLDRYCCGFTPEPTEICVENLLHNKCGNTKDLLLVHILVRKADPSRLVFIDNAGRPQQSNDNLNFRLIEGIDQFPDKAVSVLQSGCLESLLLHSLYTDKEFWDSQGGVSGLKPLIHTVVNRGKILLQYIRHKKLELKRDL